MTRGGRCARSCRTMPSTLPILFLSGSTTCLSRTSRTSGSGSSTEHLQWNGDEGDEERDDDNRGNHHVADEVIAVLAEVLAIVHQDQQREDDDGCEQRVECHGEGRDLQRVAEQHDQHRANWNRQRVDEGKPRILVRLEILAPVPAESLREEVRQIERHLQRRAEACRAEAGGEERYAPRAEDRKSVV